MVIPRSPKLCARSWVDRRATSRLLAAALAVVAAGGAGAAHAQAAHADTPSSSQYGEVARFGGFDSAAFTGSDNPSGLSAGKFVLPVGFAVDSNDSSMPDDYGIYVLDVTNPAAIHNNGTIDYRLQKLDDRGNVFATTTFQMATPQNGGYQAQYLAIDDTNHRVYTALTQRTLNRVLAWSTVPTGSGSDATLPAASGLPADDVVTNAAQLVGPTALGSLGLPHGTSMNNFAGLAVTQGTDGADVDVQGSPSNSGGGDVGIARFHADGANTGTLDGTWENTTMAEGNSLSTAPDGSLVSVAKEFVLDASNTGDPGADVTRFDSALTPTTYEPSADEVAAHQANFQSFNYYTEPVIAASRPDNWGLAGDGVELSNGDFAGTKVVQYWNAAYPWLTPGLRIPGSRPGSWSRSTSTWLPVTRSTPRATSASRSPTPGGDRSG